ncbi:hypothetical protein C8R46DRAFT_1067828 [Mycena filopes]|nr:hypothetical protein C8R46DRAFT_1067828 [Mycena filopes]
MAGAPFETLGALELGSLASFALFGVATTQVYIYFGRFPKDSRILKTLVTFIYACEVGHTICIAHTLYVYTIVDYGLPLHHLVTDAIPASLGATTFFTGLIAATVQSFFAWRIYSLSRSLYIPIICWLLAFLRVVIAVIVLIIGAIHVSIATLEAKWAFLHYLVWAESACNDLILTSALVYWLSRQRPDHMRTATLVDRLIRWTLETGMVTAGSDLVTLICFVTMTKNFVWMAWYVITAKLFSNTLLASLNSRTGLRDVHDKNITLPALSDPTAAATNASTIEFKIRTRNKESEGNTFESSGDFTASTV